MNEIVSIPTDELHPNDYNPNEMSEVELSECLAEMRHLGRLPKPVIVRANGAGYTIVDGEHGWRCAVEAKLDTVACEVVEVDDFEAMRQTYKRNQHGTHNPVKLGRMFEAMMAERKLSQRALAKETQVSEGTVRNALAYAEADSLRNCYAPEDDVAQLSIRQIREYLHLPTAIRDIWLDAGGHVDLIDAALAPFSKDDCEEAASERFGEMLDERLSPGIQPSEGRRWSRDGLIVAIRRTYRLHDLRQGMVRFIPQVDDYAAPVAQHHLGPEVLSRLPADFRDDYRLYLTPEEWADVVDRCAEKAENDADMQSMLSAAIRLALKEKGISDFDEADPRVMEARDNLKAAPAFIRDSDLNLADQVALHEATADVPADVLLTAKKDAITTLIGRDLHLCGDSKVLEQFDITADQITAESVFRNNLQRVMRARALDERARLFENPENLVNAVVEVLTRDHVIREGRIGDIPADDVLRTRLAAIPVPELKLLAGFVLGDIARDSAPSYWLEAVGGCQP